MTARLPRSAPGVGAQIPRGREALCGYSPGPEGELCPDDAEVHVFVTSGGRGLVALPSCTRHAPIARKAGRFVDEHPFTAGCADPKSIVDRRANECRNPASPERIEVHGELLDGRRIVGTIDLRPVRELAARLAAEAESHTEVTDDVPPSTPSATGAPPP